MGLDISAYSKIAFVRELDGNEELDNEIHVWGNLDGFADRFRGEPGIYRVDGEHDGFCAGSYSGYNAWRELLAKLAGYPATEYTNHWEGTRMLHAAGAWAATEGPFYELIHLADNEGAIGPEVSEKLHGDFVEWRDRAVAFSETIGVIWRERFMETYDDFKNAFAMAMNDGVVLFH